MFRAFIFKCTGGMMALLMVLSLTPASVDAVDIPVCVDIINPQPDIGIEVNVTDIDFGTLNPGEVSDEHQVTVTNIGLQTVNVTCLVIDETASVFEPGLSIDGSGWDVYRTLLMSEESDNITIALQIPSNLTHYGDLEGRIEFWGTNSDTVPIEEEEDWMTFQGSNHHLGVTPNSGPITSQVEAIWTAKTSTSGMAGFDVAPIVADGMVFMIDHRGYVQAYDLAGGSIAWEVKPTEGSCSFQLSTPVYEGGTLYVALIDLSKGPSAFAIDTSTGTVLWNHTGLGTRFAQPNTPVVYDEGRIYLGTWYSSSISGTYYCLDASDGTIIWSKNATSKVGYYWSGAAVIGQYLVYGDLGGNLTSVDKATGDLVQEVSLANLFGTPVDGLRSAIVYSENDNRIYFSDQGGYCYALGFEQATGMFQLADGWATAIGFSSSTPAVYDGRVYVGTGDFGPINGMNLLCLDTEDGDVIWNITVNGGVQASPVISTYYDDGDGEAYVYFTTNSLQGRAYCVDADGNVVWYYEPPEDEYQYTLHGVAVYGGTVIFGNDAGYLFALRGGS